MKTLLWSVVVVSGDGGGLPAVDTGAGGGEVVRW